MRVLLLLAVVLALVTVGLANKISNKPVHIKRAVQGQHGANQPQQKHQIEQGAQGFGQQQGRQKREPIGQQGMGQSSQHQQQGQHGIQGQGQSGVQHQSRQKREQGMSQGSQQHHQSKQGIISGGGSQQTAGRVQRSPEPVLSGSQIGPLQAQQGQQSGGTVGGEQQHKQQHRMTRNVNVDKGAKKISNRDNHSP